MTKSKRMIALGLASVAIISLAGCTTGNSANIDENNGFIVGETEGNRWRKVGTKEKRSIFETIKDMFDIRDDPVIGYYGCPNSKRIKKLNLIKRRFKL